MFKTECINIIDIYTLYVYTDIHYSIEARFVDTYCFKI